MLKQSQDSLVFCETIVSYHAGLFSEQRRSVHTVSESSVL